MHLDRGGCVLVCEPAASHEFPPLKESPNHRFLTCQRVRFFSVFRHGIGNDAAKLGRILVQGSALAMGVSFIFSVYVWFSPWCVRLKPSFFRFLEGSTGSWWFILSTKRTMHSDFYWQDKDSFWALGRKFCPGSAKNTENNAKVFNIPNLENLLGWTHGSDQFTIVSKLGYSLFKGLTTYLYRG